MTYQETQLEWDETFAQLKNEVSALDPFGSPCAEDTRKVVYTAVKLHDLTKALHGMLGNCRMGRVRP